MNEAQTRLDKIDPKLRDAGWGIVPGSKILVEQSAYIAPGRITTTGHKNPKKADYILEYKGMKLAVIEAKSDDTCLYGEPQEKRINPSIKNEWYYIMKAIVESGVAKSNIADKDFVEQMVEWFSKLFPLEPQETMEAEKRKLAKSISGERSRWKKGNTKQEVALKDTMASGMVRALGTKAQLMFEIAYKGLYYKLTELKQEIEREKSAAR